jgi:hypothetical protein
VKEFPGRRRPAPRGTAPELGQTLGCALAGSARVAFHEGGAEYLPMLGFRRASMLGGADAQAPCDVVVHVPHCQGSHIGLRTLSMLRLTAYSAWEAGVEAVPVPFG